MKVQYSETAKLTDAVEETTALRWRRLGVVGEAIFEWVS